MLTQPSFWSAQLTRFPSCASSSSSNVSQIRNVSPYVVWFDTPNARPSLRLRHASLDSYNLEATTYWLFEALQSAFLSHLHLKTPPYSGFFWPNLKYSRVVSPSFSTKWCTTYSFFFRNYTKVLCVSICRFAPITLKVCIDYYWCYYCWLPDETARMLRHIIWCAT